MDVCLQGNMQKVHRELLRSGTKSPKGLFFILNHIIIWILKNQGP